MFEKKDKADKSFKSSREDIISSRMLHNLNVRKKKEIMNLLIPIHSQKKVFKK